MMTDAVQKETTLWEGRPSIWNWWLPLLTADLFLLLAAALWWTGRGGYAPYAAAAAAFLYLGVGMLRLGSRYVLTNHRAISRKGLLSRRHDEVEIRDIRSITLDQTFFQRIVGVGDIGLSSAGGDGIEVSFDGVGDAAAIKERIRGARLAPVTDRRSLSAPPRESA